LLFLQILLKPNHENLSQKYEERKDLKTHFFALFTSWRQVFIF